MASVTRLMEAEKRVLESERRLGEMIGELNQKQARTDARLDEIMKAIATINLQNQKKKLKEEDGGGENGEGSGYGGQRGDWGRSTRYEFPKFDGDGFEGWVMRSEFFFKVADVPDKERVRVAALHLEGKALQWHRGFVSLQGEAAYADWGGYTTALAARFGMHAFEDPLADLRNLKQNRALQSYMDEFDELYPRTGIREDQALSFFLSGLMDELQMPVRMFKPKSLAEVYALAKLQELTVKALAGKPKGSQGGGQFTGSYYSNNKSLAVTATSFKPSMSGTGNRNLDAKPGPRLTSKEIDERRSRGLCYWCDEKYSPNHQCPKKRAFVIQMLDADSEDKIGGACGEEELDEEAASELQLSLHALWGLEGTRMMRIRGSCQKRPLRVLIDTRSTHNFLSSHLISKIKCTLVQVQSAAVEVANGQLLQCNQKCLDFKWEMQGGNFTTEVHIITLDTYDLILGVHWLSTLGDIAWNFNTLHMAFELNGVRLELKGERWESKGVPS